MQAIADTLGISSDQLKQEMSSGSMLDQIAQNHGKTGDDLINALQAKDKSRLDQVVSAGKMTADQETQALSRMKQRETSFVQKGPPPQAERGGPKAGGLDDFASLLQQLGNGASSSGASLSIQMVVRAYGSSSAGGSGQAAGGVDLAA
jgi:hypothetical protein